jgi:putative peptide zinc metalloprotease protein
MRRLTLVLIALALAVGFGAARPAEASAGGDNAAVAINTKDGSSLFRFAFKISRVGGDIVDNANAAVAFSSCESCRTTAIAIQIVLVTGSPSTVTPQNVALAVNDQCTLCQTFASAYQFVIGTDGPVKFTSDGRKELAAIKRDIRALKDEDLSPAELDQRVAAIVDRLRVVLANELVPAGAGDDQEGDGEEDEDAAEQRDLGEDEQPTTSTTEESGGTETTTTTPTDAGTTATVPTESTPTETTPTETDGTTTDG